MSNETQPRYCVNCVHHAEVGQQIGRPVNGCGRENLIDPVDGKPLYRRCAEERKDEDRCGSLGRYFEPIPEAEDENA